MSNVGPKRGRRRPPAQPIEHCLEGPWIACSRIVKRQGLPWIEGGDIGRIYSVLAICYQGEAQLVQDQAGGDLPIEACFLVNAGGVSAPQSSQGAVRAPDQHVIGVAGGGNDQFRVDEPGVALRETSFIKLCELAQPDRAPAPQHGRREETLGGVDQRCRFRCVEAILELPERRKPLIPIRRNHDQSVCRPIADHSEETRTDPLGRAGGDERSLCAVRERLEPFRWTCSQKLGCPGPSPF